MSRASEWVYLSRGLYLMVPYGTYVEGPMRVVAAALKTIQQQLYEVAPNSSHLASRYCMDLHGIGQWVERHVQLACFHSTIICDS